MVTENGSRRCALARRDWVERGIWRENMGGVWSGQERGQLSILSHWVQLGAPPMCAYQVAELDMGAVWVNGEGAGFAMVCKWLQCDG